MQLSQQQKRFQQIKAREKRAAIAAKELADKVASILTVNPTLDPHTARQLAWRQLRK